jgi:hypothetical protein
VTHGGRTCGSYSSGGFASSREQIGTTVTWGSHPTGSNDPRGTRFARLKSSTSSLINSLKFRILKIRNYGMKRRWVRVHGDTNTLEVCATFKDTARVSRCPPESTSRFSQPSSWRRARFPYERFSFSATSAYRGEQHASPGLGPFGYRGRTTTALRR